MRKDRFTDEAMAAARALADLKYSENAEDQQAFAEAYDFARCQRPNGSFYGIAEGKQCRRGTKTSDAEPAKKKSTAERMAAAYDKRKKEGSFAPKKEKKKPEAAVKPAGKKFKTDFRKEVEEATARRREKEAKIQELQKRKMGLQKKYVRANALARSKNKKVAERGAKLVELLKGNLETIDKELKSYTTLGKGGLK